MKEFIFTQSRYGHAAGDIVQLEGWDEFYLTRKGVIQPYHREQALAIETPEAPAERPQAKKRKKK